MNQFSDMTSDEFKLYIHGHSGSCVKPRTVEQRIKMNPIRLDDRRIRDVPDSIDWTNYNDASYVTPVKNQGQCVGHFQQLDQLNHDQQLKINKRDLILLHYLKQLVGTY